MIKKTRRTKQMKLKATSTINTLATCVSKELARPVLKNICIKGNEAMASNGYILARVEMKGGGSEQPLLYAPGNKLPAKVTTEITSSNDKIKFTSGNTISESCIVNESYPNVDQIYPKDDPVLKIAFNAEYLRIISDLVKGSEDNRVELEFYGERSAMLFKGKSKYKENVSGLLMPLKRKE